MWQYQAETDREIIAIAKCTLFIEIDTKTIAIWLEIFNECDVSISYACALNNNIFLLTFCRLHLAIQLLINLVCLCTPWLSSQYDHRHQCLYEGVVRIANNNNNNTNTRLNDIHNVISTCYYYYHYSHDYYQWQYRCHSYTHVKC